jgi:hypothetical protein
MMCSCDLSQQLVVPGVVPRRLALPLPRLPCRGVCDEYAGRCADFVSFVRQRAANASSEEERALFGCVSAGVTPNCSSQLLTPPLRDCQGAPVVM